MAYHRAFCERHLAAGGTALGAFDSERLVGIGVVTPHVRPGIAQLALLHVSDGYRGRGVGRRLCEIMDHIARAAGDTEMVVSATPSVNTVRFYMGRGSRRWPRRCRSCMRRSRRMCICGSDCKNRRWSIPLGFC